MKCPQCTDVTLVMTERQGVEIDYCPTCRTQPVKHSVIVARVVDTISCSGHCTSAKSGSCDCSCGGENHGSDYARIH